MYYLISTLMIKYHDKRCVAITLAFILFFASVFPARQKDMASSSVCELVLAVKDPHSLLESENRPFRSSSDGAAEFLGSEAIRLRKSGNYTPPKKSPMGKINELPEGEAKSKKYGLGFLMRYRFSYFTFLFVFVIIFDNFQHFPYHNSFFSYA